MNMIYDNIIYELRRDILLDYNSPPLSEKDELEIAEEMKERRRIQDKNRSSPFIDEFKYLSE